jgi:hypothetical protein
MLRRDLGADVEMVAGPYGSFEVRVDDKVLVEGGTLAFLGILPTLKEIRTEVAQHLADESKDDGSGGG